MTEPRTGWGLQMRRYKKPFLTGNFFFTREEAIQHYDSLFTRPNTYRRHRRQGRVLAVKVTLSMTPDS